MSDLPVGGANSAGRALRVALDATALYSGATGVARYVRELARALPSQGIDVVPFAIGRGQGDPGAVDVRRVRIPMRLVHLAWKVARAPRGEWLVPACDIFHAPDLVPPPTRRPVVMSVHDAHAVDRPDLYPPRAAAIQRRQLDAARERAAIVLTSSATAPVLESHGVARERIVVTTYGATPLPQPDFGVAPARPYFLVVGALARSKGQDVLVAALARSGLDAALVLAGPDGWGASTIRSAIERSPIVERAKVAGSVSDAQLAGLYQRCIALCVPSWTEGFGIPILEAAASGVPVVASDLPATRSLAPAVSAFVPPGDQEAWASALRLVAGDRDIARRAREVGPAYAREFTWERVAHVTATAYRRAMEDR